MQLCQLCTQYAWPCWVGVWSHWRSVDQMGPSKTTPNPQWFDRLKPSKTHHFQQHFEMPNWSTIKVTFVKPSSETSGNCSILNGYYGYYHSIEAPFSSIFSSIATGHWLPTRLDFFTLASMAPAYVPYVGHLGLNPRPGVKSPGF